MLAYHRYVERNPIKAGMIIHVEEYDWSSYRQHAGLDEDAWIVDDPIYMSLANDKAQWQRRYSDYIKRGRLRKRKSADSECLTTRLVNGIEPLY